MLVIGGGLGSLIVITELESWAAFFYFRIGVNLAKLYLLFETTYIGMAGSDGKLWNRFFRMKQGNVQQKFWTLFYWPVKIHILGLDPDP